MAEMPEGGTSVRKAVRVFISYSRKDTDAAEVLRQKLIDTGFDAYLDKHDIVKGEPWRERLRGLIESADAVVFLISPDSVASDICGWEVNEAELRAKRVFPVVIRPVADDLVPQRLQRLNYTFLDAPEKVEAEFPQLAAAIAEDAGWVREHTRLEEVALRWERAGKPNRLLLRGKDLKDAEGWRDARSPAAPDLSPLHVAFITTSRQAQGRRFATAAASALGVGAVVFAAIALVAILEANLRASQLAESRSLAAASRTQVARGDAELGVLLALAGLPGETAASSRPQSAEAEAALAFALAAYRDTAIVTAPSGRITDAAAARPGEALAGSDAGRLWTFDAITGAETRVLIEEGPAVRRVAASANGAIAAALEDGRILLWRANETEPTSLPPHSAPVVQLAFGADGASLLVVSETDFDKNPDADGRLQILPVASPAEPLLQLDGSFEVAVSPSGQLAAISASEEPVVIRRMSDASVVPGLGGPASYSNDPMAVSDDGRWLAFGDWQGVGQITDLQTHEAAAVGEGLGFRTNMNSAMSGDGIWAAFTARSGAVELWRRDTFGFKDDGDPQPGAPRTFAKDGVLEFKSSFDQQDMPEVAFSPAGKRVVFGLAGGDAALIDGLASFASYGAGDLTTTQISPARLEAAPRIVFPGEDRVMLISDKIVLTGFSPALPGLARLPDPPKGDDLDDIVDLYTRDPKNAGWALAAEGRLGEHPEWTEGEGLRADVSPLGDVLVHRIGSTQRLSRIDTQGKSVSSMAILPGGKEIAVGLSNRRLIVADIASGAVMRDFGTGMSPATTMYLDKANKRLIVFTFESQLHDSAFELPLVFPRCEALRREARGMMRRQMTPEERGLYSDAADARPALLSGYLSLRQSLTAWLPRNHGCGE
jgi:hypothetical protein